MPKANELQVGGTHYKTDYQHWDFTADVLEGRYMEGQIAKYISRARKKNGASDYRKAEHFCAKLIEQNGAPPLNSPEDHQLVVEFCFCNELNELESFSLHMLAGWRTPEDLQTVLCAAGFLATRLETPASLASGRVKK